ncbi:MAG: hypothetical protein ACTSX9_05420 [Candidatus Njordarchaeales archaeon]
MGINAALEAAKRGLKVVILEAYRLGGRARIDELPLEGMNIPLSHHVKKLIEELKQYKVQILENTVLAGVFEDAVLAYNFSKPAPVTYLVNAKAWVLATGSIELPGIYENNDLPGTIDATTLLLLVNEYDFEFNRALLLGLTPFSTRIVKQLAPKGIRFTIAVKRDSPYYSLVNEIRELENIGIIDDVEEIVAKGGEKVKEAMIKRLNGKEHRVATDLIAFGALENPDLKIPNQFGCRIIYVNGLGFVPIS